MTAQTKVYSVLPRPVRIAAKMFLALFAKPAAYDSSSYWRSRAKMPGEAAVLWHNPVYNGLFRDWQRAFLTAVAQRGQPSNAVEVGCGVGIVTRIIADVLPNAKVHGVDFPEMIAQARDLTPQANVTYFPSTAEAYLPAEKYDWVVSSGLYSAILDDGTRFKAMANAIDLLAPGGRLIMMDPLHRYAYLARAAMTAQEAIDFYRERGLTLESHNGALFWPFREYLSARLVEEGRTRRLYELGEKLLHLLGERWWSDYKVLVFRKPA